ncbi:MAG: phosphoribosyl-ATP diphosphatase [Magnetococcales bacterium]|nr:phosphoribosyl-ATP diphosphatase [Magnetococcales bacterium]
MTQRNGPEVLTKLFALLQERRQADPKSSYTATLLNKGLNAILDKVAEESEETIEAARSGQSNEIVHESADLIYHLLVMLVQQDIALERVLGELGRRLGRSGHLRHDAPVTPSNRSNMRHHHCHYLTLHFNNGQIVTGTTQDISLTGLMLSVNEDTPLDDLLGETGTFDLTPARTTTHAAARNIQYNPLPTLPELANLPDNPLNQAVNSFRFTFEIVRVTPAGLGLHIIDGSGLFGFTFSTVFKEIF